MKFQRFLIALFLLALLSVPMLAQTQTDIRLLPDQTIEREMTGAETHRYKFDLQANEFFQVLVEQKGVDVALKLLDADGKTLATMDSPNGKEGLETLSLVTEKAGNFVFEVSGFDEKAEKGIYIIKRQASRPATAVDKRRVEVERLFVEGIAALVTQGQGEIAVKKLEEALAGWRELKDEYLVQLTVIQVNQLKRIKANAMLTEAREVVIQGTAEAKQAIIPKLVQAGKLFREIGDERTETTCLVWLGIVYNSLGEKQKALEFYNQALPLFIKAGDIRGQATTLGNIGSVYLVLDEYQKALDFLNQALPLFIKVGNVNGQSATLNNIGLVYLDLGEKQKALEFYNQALPLFIKAGDVYGQANTLNNIGGVYYNLGDNQKALEFYNQALPLHIKVGNVLGQALALASMGNVYSSLRENQKALEFYNQALPLFIKVGDVGGQANTLHNIGSVYSHLGENQKALDFLNQALPLRIKVGDVGGQAATLSGMMFVWESLKNNQLAIFYGKQSINVYQRLRTNIKDLDKEMQQTYIKSIVKTYRTLADVFIAEGRLAEAEQDLNLFKDQQFFDFNRNPNEPIKQLNQTPRENEFSLRYQQSSEQIGKVDSELDELKRKIGARQPTADETIQLQKLETDLKTTTDAFLTVLKQAETEFSKPVDEKDKVGAIPDTGEMQTALRALNSQTGQKTVAVYTLVGEDNFRALIVSPDGIKSVSSPIKGTDLNDKALKLWGLLQSDKYDTSVLSKQIYDDVFKSIELKLPKGTTTIMWSLDGNLRYIPIAALWDGKQYLVERYRIVVFTRAESKRMLAPVSATWTGSGFYTSKEYSLPVRSPDGKMILIGLDGLKNAKTEVETIFGVSPNRGIISGDLLFNEQFTKESLFKALKLNRPLVHIASHFKFEAGNASSSFLLLGDGTKLTLEDIKNAPDDLFKGVELLTLSACETGVQKERESDGREIDSFAELAQRKGAKAILASLWKVDDESTSQLMTEFYSNRESKKLTKAEALQKAQLRLLKSKNYSHPYYWSPFILVGNWR
jgi:CHAT domain-containing protein/Tfp pilus assembly protein PilF